MNSGRVRLDEYIIRCTGAIRHAFVACRIAQRSVRGGHVRFELGTTLQGLGLLSFPIASDPAQKGLSNPARLYSAALLVLFSAARHGIFGVEYAYEKVTM
ncbi:hypothetical protein RSAG8_09604, partial [Rhizoctonia solani AG-8 WAC10335]